VSAIETWQGEGNLAGLVWGGEGTTSPANVLKPGTNKQSLVTAGDARRVDMVTLPWYDARN